ncbi:MAG: hypothetical protein PHI90_10560, partial [Clostridia bacterium]|nr:hypothetical protein [Clostridia bacterium]
KIFLKDTGDNNTLIDQDLYSIFLKDDEMNKEGIRNSLKDTVNYINIELEKNIKTMKMEFEKNIMSMESLDFEKGIGEFAEKATNQAVEIVQSTYNSVETILMGVELFTLGKKLHDAHDTYDTEDLMEWFSENVDGILENEIQRIIDFLNQEKQNYIDYLSNFPEFSIE